MVVNYAPLCYTYLMEKLASYRLLPQVERLLRNLAQEKAFFELL